MNQPTYIVWRRADGYIGASNVSSRPGRRCHEGKELLRTHSWDEAHALIERLRDTDEHRALVAGWSR